MPESLVAAMGDFAGGAISLKDIREVLAEEVRNNPSHGGIIQEMLRDERKAKRLSKADYGELLSGIDAALSENVPTEASEEAPSEPGIYHVDHEGTLVLSDDEAPVHTPIEAYDSVESPGGDKVKDAQQTKAQEKLPELKVGAVLRDRFRLEEEIARGSMGVVYRAVDLLKKEAGTSDPFIAVKIISPEFASHSAALKTFQNEIANTQRLSHPNIIHLFELDRDGDYYFITMEWLEGESLDALLDRSQGSALPPVQTYAIIEQLCDALAYAHKRDVIHADVKPGNVFLVKTGELKLIDFGIARVEASLADGDKSSKESLPVALTPAYASCERLERATPTAQDDLYSLACMIYRLLSGRRVFGAMNALEAEKVAMEPVRIGGMDDNRWNALRQALSFRSAYRQNSVKEFAKKFGQRRTPRDVKPVEQEHTDTRILESLPEGALNNDTTKLEVISETASLDTLHETVELQALAGAGELSNSMESPVDEPAGKTQSDAEILNVQTSTTGQSDLEVAVATNDTTSLDALYETSHLQAMAGGDALRNSDNVPQEHANNNVLHVDTVKLEAEPEFELFTTVSAEEEVPYVDTVNLDAAPEPVPETINIMEGDGAGFLPETDLDTAFSEAAKEPPVQSAQAVPVPRVKQEKIVPADILPPRHKERLTRQLGGAGQQQLAGKRQVAAAWWSKKPALAAGGLLSVIAVMIGIGFMMSGIQPEPLTQVRLTDESVRASASLAIARPVIVDLTVSGNQPSTEANTDSATISIDQTVPVELVSADANMDSVTASVELTSTDTITELAAEPVDLTAPLVVVPAEAITDSAAVPVKPTALLSNIQDSNVPVPVVQASEDKFLASAVVVPVVPTGQTEVVKPVDLSPIATVEESRSKPFTDSVTTTKAQTVSKPVVVQLTQTDVAPMVSVPVPTSEPVIEPVAPAPVIAAPKVLSNSELQNKARKALTEGRLVQPGNDNAAYWLEQLRARGSDIPGLITAEAELATSLTRRAEEAYIAGDINEAKRWIELARHHGVSEDELTPVRASIAKLERDNAAAAKRSSLYATPAEEVVETR